MAGCRGWPEEGGERGLKVGGELGEEVGGQEVADSSMRTFPASPQVMRTALPVTATPTPGSGRMQKGRRRKRRSRRGRKWRGCR